MCGLFSESQNACARPSFKPAPPGQTSPAYGSFSVSTPLTPSLKDTFTAIVPTSATVRLLTP